MCGIAGWILKEGSKAAASKSQAVALFTAAASRGRDASGIYFEKNGEGIIVKDPVESGELALGLPWRDILRSPVVLMHTRHATQGDPRDNVNNHPLTSSDGNTVIIHNGVIHNSWEYVSREITDSYSLIEAYEIYRREHDTFALGFRRGLGHLTGSIACAAYNRAEGRLLLIRRDNPLCMGVKKNTVFFASTMAIIGHVNPGYITIAPENYLYSIKGKYMRGFKIKKGGESNGKTWRDYNRFGEAGNQAALWPAMD